MEGNKKGIAVSIIIPTYNRADILAKALELVTNQLKNFESEVIIIDDGSDKYNGRKILELSKNKWVRLLKTKNKGPAHARNAGIDKAKGEIIIFLNDDSLITPKYIQKHLNFHKKFKDINFALTGKTQDHPDTVRCEAMKWLVGSSGLHFNYKFDEDKQGQIPWYYFWTCNISVKREFLTKSNLRFSEEFPTAAWEDIEFAYRAKEKGLVLYFDPTALVYHFHEMNFEDIRERFVSHGRGLYHIHDKLPANFLPFLIKYRTGNIILWLFQTKLVQSIFLIIEKIVKVRDRFPNFLMQFLVISWKARGYALEKNKRFASS